MDTSLLTTSLRDLITVLFKRKWSIFVVLFVSLFSSMVYLFLIRDDTYTTVSKILIRVGPEQAPSTTVIGQPPNVVSYRNHDVNSEIDLLMSTDLVAQLVDELHLDVIQPKPVPEGFFRKVKYYAKKLVSDVKEFVNNVMIMIGLREQLNDRDKAIELVVRGLHVEAVEESNTVLAALTMNVRQNLSVVLDHHVQNYLKFRRKAFESPDAPRFFDEKVTQTRTRLNEAEKKLTEYENKGGIINIEAQKASLLAQLELVRNQFDAAEREHHRSQFKVEQLEKMLSGSKVDFAALGEFAPETFPKNLLDRLTTLEMEREILRMSDAEDSARVKTNRSQWQVVVDLISSNLRSALAERQADVHLLASQRSSLEKELDDLHSRQAQWRSLQRDVSSLEESLNFYLRKLEEASAQAQRDEQIAGSASVIQHPIDPLMASGIRKTYLILAAALLSLVAAIAWAALCEFFDHRVYSLEVLEQHLSAPVLAVVPVDKSLRKSLP
ncbi:hypothetical protein K2X85_13660 [bacterium]|nr:hypothetical protein [bacterium]